MKQIWTSQIAYNMHQDGYLASETLATKHVRSRLMPGTGAAFRALALTCEGPLKFKIF